MSDSSNPFAALSGKFPDAKKKGVAAPAARDTAGGKQGGSFIKKKTGAVEAESSEDAALFLDAMGSIKPLKRGKAKTEDENGMAAALKAVLPTPREGGKGKRGRHTPVPGVPPMPDQSSPASVAQNTGASGPLAGPTAAMPSAAKETLSSFAELQPTRGDAPNEADNAGTGTRPVDIPESAFSLQITPGPVEEDLFGKAMQGVAPLAARGREITPPSTAGTAQTPPVDPAKALRDLLEGRVEFALYHSDEYMEGHVVGVDHAVLGRLRSGQLSPEAHLDLHGQNARQALDALTLFIKNAYQRSLRTVTVVTGRGKNSPGGIGVLRPMLQEWLTKDPFKRVVLAFCTAQPSDGGPGAVYVLLRKYKKNRGKIIWESAPPDADTAL